MGWLPSTPAFRGSDFVIYLDIKVAEGKMVICIHQWWDIMLLDIGSCWQCLSSHYVSESSRVRPL